MAAKPEAMLEQCESCGTGLEQGQIGLCDNCNQPSEVQLAALQRYADANGRSWKGRLSQAWSTGADERGPDAAYLRQVRNQHGPEWLYSKRNTIRPQRFSRRAC